LEGSGERAGGGEAACPVATEVTSPVLQTKEVFHHRLALHPRWCLQSHLHQCSGAPFLERDWSLPLSPISTWSRRAFDPGTMRRTQTINGLGGSG